MTDDAFADRVLRLIDFDGPDGCWLWCGAVHRNQFETRGRIRVGAGRRVFVYRVTYEHLRGPIPASLLPDHLCRRTICVNPWHIEFVTHRTNVLRGVGVTAVNARKEFCRRGHRLADENVLPVKTKWGTWARWCLTCKRQDGLAYYRRHGGYAGRKARREISNAG